MKADLERRVHELLDAGASPADDPELRQRLADDPEAGAEVAALAQVDRWLRDWEVSVPEADLEPIAQRIEQRLGEPLGSLDVTAPPEFDDPDARVRSLGDRAGRSGEYSLAALSGAVDAPAPAQVTGPSPAIPLGAPRPEMPSDGGRPLAPWLAAAAAVGLAVIVGTATFRANEPSMVSEAAAPAAAGEEPWLPPLPGTPAEQASAEATSESAPVVEMEEAEAVAAEEEADDAIAQAVPREERSPQGGLHDPEGNPGGSRRRARRTSGAAGMTASRGASALNDAVGGAGSPPTTTATSGMSDAAFERSRPAVRACLGGVTSAVIMVRFVDGTVRSANVVRPEASDAVDDCVASALRRSRLRPQDGQSSRTIFYRWGSPGDHP